MKPIPAADSPRDPDKYYGPPCIPGVIGHVWECDSKEEYTELRAAYEDSEANCNTCRHLKRTPHPKQSGWLEGICLLDGHKLRFHADDPLNLPCYESRRSQPKE